MLLLKVQASQCDQMSPVRISDGLVVELDASIGGSLTLTGSRVDGWADQSGNANHAATTVAGVAYNPLYSAGLFGGLGGVRFDPTGTGNGQGYAMLSLPALPSVKHNEYTTMMVYNNHRYFEASLLCDTDDEIQLHSVGLNGKFGNRQFQSTALHSNGVTKIHTVTNSLGRYLSRIDLSEPEAVSIDPSGIPVSVSPNNLTVIAMGTALLELDSSFQALNSAGTSAATSFTYDISVLGSLSIMLNETASCTQGDYICANVPGADDWVYIWLSIDGNNTMPTFGDWFYPADANNFHVRVDIQSGNSALENSQLLKQIFDNSTDFTVGAGLTAVYIDLGGSTATDGCGIVKIGGNWPNSPTGMAWFDCLAIYIWDRVLSEQEIEAHTRYVSNKFDTTLYKPTHNIIFDGNSLAFGHGGIETHFIPEVMDDLSLRMENASNLGQAARTITDMVDDFSTRIAPLYISSIHSDFNVVVGWEITNELVVLGASTAAIQQALQDYAAAARAAGFKVVLVTCLPRTTVGGQNVTFEAQRQTINAWLVSNPGGFCDAVADVASDTDIGEAGDNLNGTYYSDGLHLTDAGYAKAAPYISAAIATII
jgi:hypothetical protein